jgi:hypothetical protein
MSHFVAIVLANVLFIFGTLVLLWTLRHWLVARGRKKQDKGKGPSDE